MLLVALRSPPPPRFGENISPKTGSTAVAVGTAEKRGPAGAAGGFLSAGDPCSSVRGPVGVFLLDRAPLAIRGRESSSPASLCHFAFSLTVGLAGALAVSASSRAIPRCTRPSRGEARGVVVVVTPGGASA